MSGWVSLFLIAAVGWVGLHPWLAKRGYRRVLTALIVSELAGFALLYRSVTRQVEQDVSVGMAAGLFIVAGVVALIAPAVTGVAALWIYRRADAKPNARTN